MKIAVLGWGSLIWDSRELEIPEEDWIDDGPILPLEFARISSDGRLTIVSYPDGQENIVLWAIMKQTELVEAREKLRQREGPRDINKIGFINIQTRESSMKITPDYYDEVYNWALQKGFDAVVWTDLETNFEEKENREFNDSTVIEYLQNIDEANRKKVEKYIRKAPSQIRTPIRSLIEEKLVWSPI